MPFYEISRCLKLKSFSFFPYFDSYNALFELADLRELEMKMPGPEDVCTLAQIAPSSLPQISSLKISGVERDCPKIFAALKACANLKTLSVKLSDERIPYTTLREFLEKISRISR